MVIAIVVTCVWVAINVALVGLRLWVVNGLAVADTVPPRLSQTN
ncbi:hypothetical protein [Bradyrhizobium sp. JYMT SZCCT0428]|nr:hypothetical protein [Bradyrhizobium sp. JYMT SZCCT0428]